MKHPVKHLGFPEASIETVTKFVQVTGQMLVTDAMIDSTDISFDVGDQSMDPGQYLRSFFPEPGTSHHEETGSIIQEAVALPTIGPDHRLGCQTLLSHGLNLVAAYPGHLAHGGKPGFICRGFHRHHNFGFTRGATATFAWFGGTDIGIVHLDQPANL